MSKEILELLKGLLKKILSHLELPEPKGRHPQVEEEKVEMNIRKNYMTEREIQEELKNGVIEKHVRVYEMGKDDALYFVKCEDCYGPIVGHLEKKCPKENYSYEELVKFEEYVENIKGFQ